MINNDKMVAILGCGPAGLLVAHAMFLREQPFVILSQKTPSHIAGAQYLHSHIPHITDEEGYSLITYTRLGTPEGYAKKIYGDEDAPTSWHHFGDTAHAWPLQRCYQLLWETYEGRVIPYRADPQSFLQLAGEFKAVISTMPRTAIQYGHFQSETVTIKSTDHEFAIQGMTIIYNGREWEPWYRASNLFGHSSVEYPGRANDGFVIRKPLKYETDINTTPDNCHFMGRYGKWQKGVLVDHAFHEAMELELP